MASLNKILIIGNLGQDPELRYTANQTAVVTLNIATTENWSKDGQKQEHTEWHRVIVWSKQAENCAKYLSKGRSVFIEGKLQTRSWDDKNGQKRYSTEIIASNVQFLANAGSSASRGSQPYASAASQASAPSVDTNYFPQAQQAPKAPQTSEKAMDALDDIPF